MFPPDLVSDRRVAVELRFAARHCLHRIDIHSITPHGLSSLLNGLAILGDSARVVNVDMPLPRGPALRPLRLEGPTVTRHGYRNGVADAFHLDEVATGAKGGSHPGTGLCEGDEVVEGRTRSPSVISDEHDIGSSDLIWLAQV